MNKIIPITAFVFVAVVMGMSAIAPALPQAIADHSVASQGFTCPPDTPEHPQTANLVWEHVAFSPAGDSPDLNGNGFVCENNFVELPLVANKDRIRDDIPNPQG